MDRKRMDITCISDLHGFYPDLEGGDLLIVAGDLTAHNKEEEYFKLFDCLGCENYKEIIIIAGNHDNFIQSEDGDSIIRHWTRRHKYLKDSGTEFQGLKIWGSPWTKTFEEMNPRCKAFTVDTEEELAGKWALIPDDVDILVTHCPAYGILDQIKNYQSGKIECVGSKSLQMELYTRLNPKLFVCGHIHEGYGIEPPGGFVERAVNASIMNENYEPVNKPIRVTL